MRLLGIEAVRFGRVDGLSLSGLSPRLTVVCGPNEAGKSSLTALVRYVLYGFPTPGAVSEPPYLSAGGKREGRLVFGDGAGEWVIERGEGPNGGPVAVRALTGEPRAALVAELTAGVSKSAYRVVYGFGLADMQQIEMLKGKDDDLFQQLYAAGAGLGARLLDARSEIDGAIEALWKKGGSAPALNRLKRERDESRAAIRALVAETESVRGDVLRLESLQPELEAAREERTRAQMGAEQVSRAVADAERFLTEAATATEEAERLGREAAAATADAASHAADPAVLVAAGTVDALAGELSGYREQTAAVSSLETRSAALSGRLRAAVADSGWSLEHALAAASDVGVGPEIEDARARISKAQARLEIATAAVDSARAQETGDGVLEPAGRPWLVPAMVMAALGAAGVIAGLVTSQMLLSVFAALLLIAGFAMALIRRGASMGGALSVRARAASVESEHAAALASLEEIRAAWAGLVRSRGLGEGGEDPAAVSARYQAARAVRTAEGERAEVAAELQRAREAAAAFAGRVGDVIGPLLSEPSGAPSPDRVSEFVSRGVDLVAGARAAATAETAARGRSEALQREAAEQSLRAGAASSAAAATLASIGAEGGALQDARDLEVAAREAAKDAADEFDRLSTEVAELKTRLGSEGRDATLSELRLTDESLGERIADGVRQYAVLTLAASLLARAQSRYERDRQPAVVKRAEAAFALMTDGRYPRISVPLGKDAIEVFDAASAAVSPGQLSRGTAEQLYLALRLGLIEQSGDVGADLPVLMDDVLVDFSPKRAEQAARAIADLATRRQVVFLTCHPATADLLCGVAPDSVRLELPGPV